MLKLYHKYPKEIPPKSGWYTCYLKRRVGPFCLFYDKNRDMWADTNLNIIYKDVKKYRRLWYRIDVLWT